MFPINKYIVNVYMYMHFFVFVIMVNFPRNSISSCARTQLIEMRSKSYIYIATIGTSILILSASVFWYDWQLRMKHLVEWQMLRLAVDTQVHSLISAKKLIQFGA